MMICPPPSQPPVGLCYCGCGFPTAYLKYDYPRQGYVKGEYRKYINGHNGRGKSRPRDVIEKGMDTRRRLNKPRPPVSAETRAKMSAIQKARHAHRPERYDGGYPNQRDRWSPENVAWRKAVFERDKYVCQKCGQVGGKLNAHHLKPWAQYPRSRFEIANGLTVCVKCHKEYPRKVNQLGN